MNKYLSSNKQAGFSMIEVLMALVVVGLVLTAVAGMITNSMETRADARYRQVANEIAQKFIEQCRREQAIMKWSDFISQSDHECIAKGPVSEPLIGISFSKVITVASTSTPPETYTVNVDVTWSTGRNGGTEEESLEVSQVFTNRN